MVLFVFVRVLFSVCVDLCAQSCVLIYYICLCAYWEYMLSLTTGSAWGNGASTASPLSGYWIWQPLTHTDICVIKPLE